MFEYYLKIYHSRFLKQIFQIILPFGPTAIYADESVVKNQESIRLMNIYILVLKILLLYYILIKDLNITFKQKSKDNLQI
jgi:hypothetical protein